MMKILITGGAGFIGTHLAKSLASEHQILVFDNFLKQVHGDGEVNYVKSVEYFKGDITDLSDWKKVLEFDPHVIIHLAAETGTGQSMDEMTRYAQTNILGTTNMLDLLNGGKYNVGKIILASSRAIYGEGKNDTAKKNPNPVSIYGLTKLAQENLIKIGCKIPYTIFRYQNVYGPGQSLSNPYTGIISIFSVKFFNEEPVEIWDNGIPTRDFVFVEDVVKATMLAIDNKKSDYKTYDVGTGISTSILEMAKKLRQKINPNCLINLTDYHRDGDVIHAKAENNKLKEELNWQIQYDLDKGIDCFVDWFYRDK